MLKNIKKIIVTLSFIILHNHVLAETNIAYSKLEQDLIKQGYVDIQKLDPSIKVDMMYAKADNFVGKILYKGLNHAFLHQDAAKAIVQAQKYLKQEYPNYSLIIYDSIRPMRVQQQLWDKVKNTSKQNYVSNPRNGGGLHNYGLAVDISIVDQYNKPLDMGVKVDYLGEKSHIDKEQYYYQIGDFTKKNIENRELLRRVMRKAGFKPLKSEWWHFNYKSRKEAKKYYQLVP